MSTFYDKSRFYKFRQELPKPQRQLFFKFPFLVVYASFLGRSSEGDDVLFDTVIYVCLLVPSKRLRMNLEGLIALYRAFKGLRLIVGGP